MTNRFRRRRAHRHGHTHPEGMAPGRRRRVIRTAFWMGAALLILAAVLGYDRNAVQEAQRYVEEAESHIAAARYDDAVVAYQRAFDNPRLTRARKAEIALAVGDLEYERFKDYDSASAWYHRAKRIHPKTTETPMIKERMAEADRLAASDGRTPSVAESVADIEPGKVREVQLVSAPIEDQQGPVLASYEGGQLYAGEVQRAMADLPLASVESLKTDRQKLEGFVREQLHRDLLYHAAVQAGYDKQPDISARLYDYQRALISERYLSDLRQQSQTVPNSRVEEYYQVNRNQYVQPGKVALAMVKAENAEKAAEARQALVNGVPFADVATSYSLDKESARTQGVVGLVTDTATSIPGVGNAPDLVRELFKLPVGSVTAPTQVNERWFIFKVLSVVPPRATTLDEARPAIERILRAEMTAETRDDLPRTLAEKFGARVDGDKLEGFWELRANGEGTTPTQTSVGLTTSTQSVSGGGS